MTVIETLATFPAAFAKGCVALGKTWKGRFILLLVTSQLLLPLRYYINHRDPHDERFAWRMFSPMRMSKCTPKFDLDGKPIPMASTFHEAWYEIAARGRFEVIEEMGALLCKQHPGSEVTVTLDCSYIDRESVRYGGFNICAVPEL
jgi:hypothetical protein